MTKIVVKKKLLNIIGTIKISEKRKKSKYKNLTEEEKELKRQYSRDRYDKIKSSYYAPKE